MIFPTANALLIGIGTSAHAPQLNVPITAADASAVAAVLRDPQYCGYLPEQVSLLSDAATSREVSWRRSMDWRRESASAIRSLSSTPAKENMATTATT